MKSQEDHTNCKYTTHNVPRMCVKNNIHFTKYDKR